MCMSAKNVCPNFIESFDIDSSLCQEIINFYEEYKDHHIAGASGGQIDEKKKKSTDLVIYPSQLNNKEYIHIKTYIENLHKCYISYKEKWPFLKEPFDNLEIGAFNIQKYNIGGHFAKVHCERDSLTNLNRLFAFMTYLNDDFEGGHTFFSHYDLKIIPKTGKTLIWPAEWTHAHKGDIVKSGTKYIITGWLDIPFFNE
jgi:prolyl 4-hydroxylase